MKILGEFEYVIGSHFLPALFNGDVTGLDDAECAEIERFEEVARAFAAIEYPDMASAHWDYDETGEGFARCEVTDLMGDCCRVRLVIMGE